MKKTTKRIVVGALIAALYTGLTFMSNFLGLAYGAVQFRLSEALTVLAVFSPDAVWGLTVGCFISNMMSFNPVDMIFGTVATLCAALLSYGARKIKLFNLPLISLFIPVIINAAVVGAEIVIFVSKSATVTAFLLSAAWVALGETVTCVVLGGFLYAAVTKNHRLYELIT